MSEAPGNKAGVQLLLLLLLAATLAAFFANASRTWPFVAYNMYARLPLASPRTFTFEGTDRKGNRFVLEDESFFRPYFRHDLIAMLNGGREPEKVLALLFSLNESRWPLSSLRLYRIGAEGKMLVQERKK